VRRSAIRSPVLRTGDEEDGMAQRRVVTEEAGGRSRVASDGEAARVTLIQDALWLDQLWTTSASVPLGHVPGGTELFAAPGAVLWTIGSVPPDAALRQLAAGTTAAPGGDQGEVGQDGFHRTGTIDYVFILDGDIVLELDDGQTLLHAGDCVVQRRTNHAWRNRGDQPVRLLTIMTGLA
jgi:mannose-6-phosphate isomerase-like protein (cupin superfamily)